MKQVLSSPTHVTTEKQVTVESGVSILELQKWLDKNKVKLTPRNSVVLTEVFVTGITGKESTMYLVILT
jgi:hypothetical protein